MLYFPLTADVIAEPTLADSPQTLLAIALVVAALLLPLRSCAAAKSDSSFPSRSLFSRADFLL